MPPTQQIGSHGARLGLTRPTRGRSSAQQHARVDRRPRGSGRARLTDTLLQGATARFRLPALFTPYRHCMNAHESTIVTTPKNLESRLQDYLFEGVEPASHWSHHSGRPRLNDTSTLLSNSRPPVALSLDLVDCRPPPPSADRADTSTDEGAVALVTMRPGTTVGAALQPTATSGRRAQRSAPVHGLCPGLHRRM